MARNYRNEARQKLPSGYHVLSATARVEPTDLVWSWSSGEWLRADSPLWINNPMELPFEELICVARKPGLSEFEAAVSKRKFYLVR